MSSELLLCAIFLQWKNVFRKCCRTPHSQVPKHSGETQLSSERLRTKCCFEKIKDFPFPENVHVRLHIVVTVWHYNSNHVLEVIVHAFQSRSLLHTYAILLAVSSNMYETACAYLENSGETIATNLRIYPSSLFCLCYPLAALLPLSLNLNALSSFHVRPQELSFHTQV